MTRARLALMLVQARGFEAWRRAESGRGRASPRCAQHAGFEQGELVARLGGLLEFQVAGVFQHLFFQALDFAGQVFFAHFLDLAAGGGFRQSPFSWIR